MRIAPITLACTITVVGEQLKIDFAGSDPTLAAAINVPMCYTRAVAAYAVKSLRFTQSYVEALKDAATIGGKPRLLRSSGGAVSVPAVKLSRFRFTSSTR